MASARGILYKLISVAMFIIMSALIKATSADIPPGEAVFFRSFFALPVIFIWLLMRGNLRTGLRVISPIGHFWRGFAGTAAMPFSPKGQPHVGVRGRHQAPRSR